MTGEVPQNKSNLEGSLVGALKLIMLIGTHFDAVVFVFQDLSIFIPCIVFETIYFIKIMF
jgi:hypothetical protein